MRWLNFVPNPESVKRTWQEWDRLEIDGIVILDPDGFRSFPIDSLYTRKEFLHWRNFATCISRSDLNGWTK